MIRSRKNIKRRVGLVHLMFNGNGAEYSCVLAGWIDEVGRLCHRYDNSHIRVFKGKYHGNIIKEALRGQENSCSIRKWVYYMLAGQAVTANKEESSLERRGCPHGGVLPPLLFKIMVNELLGEIHVERCRVVGCFNDLKITIGDPNGNHLENP